MHSQLTQSVIISPNAFYAACSLNVHLFISVIYFTVNSKRADHLLYCMHAKCPLQVLSCRNSLQGAAAINVKMESLNNLLEAALSDECV